MERSRTPKADPIPVPFWLRIEDGYLVSDQTAPKYATPKPTLLEDFLQIRTDQAILEFARKWGTLGICKEHGIPGCGEQLPGRGPCWPEQVRPYQGSEVKGSVWREPLRVWHRIVVHANAMRAIGESIQNGGAGSKLDWERIIIPEDRSVEHRDALLSKIMAETGTDHLGQPWKSARSARLRFSGIMESWLDLGNIRPCFDWERDRWAIRSSIGAGLWPLFGHLALNLAVAVAGGMQSEICSFCGREYFPQRRPTRGQRNCCGDESCKRDYWRQNKRIKAARVERDRLGVPEARSR